MMHMPGNQSFIDTNVLIYLLSADAERADRAEAIVLDGGTISVQVLNEVANVANRKLAMPWQEINSEDMQDGLLIDNQICIRNPFSPNA